MMANANILQGLCKERELTIETVTSKVFKNKQSSSLIFLLNSFLQGSFTQNIVFLFRQCLNCSVQITRNFNPDKQRTVL